MERKKYIKNFKRVVVKIGTSSLSNDDGILDQSGAVKFVNDVSRVIKSGVQAIVVTSGAIAAGLQYLGMSKRPGDISVLQAAAAVGQVELMKMYGQLFAEKGLKVGQILITQEDTSSRKQYLNIKSTIEKLLEFGIVPVINENDSVAVEEIKFGDNDSLAALVSSLMESGLLIILSDVDGLYDKNPSGSGDARLINFVEKITPEIEKLAGPAGSAYSLGGMVSKIKAAKVSTFSGIPLVIANSKTEDVLAKIINLEQVGTFFAPMTGKRVKSLKRWIAFGIHTRGKIYLDRGAVDAVILKGKSVLPVGVVRLEGNFKKGDTLKVFSTDGHLIAKGICNLSCEDINKVKGKNEKQIMQEFGRELCCEVIHRDSLVVFDQAGIKSNEAL